MWTDVGLVGHIHVAARHVQSCERFCALCNGRASCDGPRRWENREELGVQEAYTGYELLLSQRVKQANKERGCSLLRRRHSLE